MIKDKKSIFQIQTEESLPVKLYPGSNGKLSITSSNHLVRKTE